MKTNKFLVPFLLVTIVFLMGVCVYQQRIIAQQSFEIRWLLSNSRR